MSTNQPKIRIVSFWYLYLALTNISTFFQQLFSTRSSEMRRNKKNKLGKAYREVVGADKQYKKLKIKSCLKVQIGI
jgi:hypothetical protein